jgi:hypothetical protein
MMVAIPVAAEREAAAAVVEVVEIALSRQQPMDLSSILM